MKPCCQLQEEVTQARETLIPKANFEADSQPQSNSCE